MILQLLKMILNFLKKIRSNHEITTEFTPILDIFLQPKMIFESFAKDTSPSKNQKDPHQQSQGELPYQQQIQNQNTSETSKSECNVFPIMLLNGAEDSHLHNIAVNHLQRTRNN